MSVLRQFIPHKCKCGAGAVVKTERCAEDAMATWVECPKCRTTGDVIEDAYSDPAAAIDSWNRGERFPAAPYS